MNIKQFAAKLRRAADCLDELMEVEGTAEIAKRITASVVKSPKLHWTQRPENRARVLKQMRKAKRAQYEK